MAQPLEGKVEETFLDSLKRVLEEAREEMARKAKEPPRWRPETLRAVAFKLACAKAVVDYSELVEALDAAATEIERLADSVKWAYIRAKQGRRI